MAVTCVLFIGYYLQSAVNPHISLCCIVLQSAENRVRLVSDLDWNQQSSFAMWKVNPISCPVEAVQIPLVTWWLELRCDAVFMTSSPSSSARFSLLAVIFRTTLNKSHLGNSNNTYKKHLCVVESAFTFSFSPIPQLSQYHKPVMANLLQTECLNRNPKLTHAFQSANMGQWTFRVRKNNLCIKIFCLKRNTQ